MAQSKSIRSDRLLSCVTAGLRAKLSSAQGSLTQAMAKSVNPGLCSGNLVDPASSHMLCSRTKPCMSQRTWMTTNL